VIAPEQLDFIEASRDCERLYSRRLWRWACGVATGRTWAIVCAIAGSVFLMVGMANAQSASDSTSSNSIIVTATKTKSDVTSVSPLTTVTAEQMALSSTTTLEQVMQTMPAMGFQGINSANAGGFGVYFVDLRSLNFNRTLTVVDGLRFVVSGIKTDEAVDLNNVPISLIDHIDILRSGSEPVYGADAVAGVVNVVLKKNFDGLLMNAYGGGATQGGDGTGEFNVTWGRNFDRGNVTVNLGYFNRDAIPQSSRAFAADPITDATIGANGLISSIVGIPATPGGHAVSSDGTIDDVFFGVGPGQFRPFDAATDSYNFAQDQDLQGSLKRATANVMGYYDLTPKLRASVQVLFSDRESDLTLAPQTLGLAGTLKNPEGFVVPIGAGGNPYDEPVELERVMNEVGPLEPDAQGYTYRVVAKLDGELGRFDWTLSYDHGESHTIYSIYNSVNLTKALALASCLPGAGCMSADFFGPDSLTSAAADYLRYTDVSVSDYTEDIGQFSARTTVGMLPGGAITAVVGGELRSETGYTHMDPVTLAGDQATPDSADTSGAYNSQEVYLDVAWPILAGKPWARSLDLETAVRYSHFNLFGGYPTWKVSGSYAPDDNIRFRATVGLARRQPAITEAFAGLSAGITAVQDPCDSVSGLLANPVVAANCRAQGLPANFVQSSPLIDIASGGNPRLTPETSNNVTVGVVLTPQIAPGLTSTADYYKYDIKNAIDSLADTDANFIPDTCYQSSSLSSPLCALVQRTASGPNAGQINRILALDSNLGAIVTDGFDFDVNYKHAFSNGLWLIIDWQSNYLLNFMVDEEGTSIQYAGRFASLVNTGSYAHFKSLLATTVQVGPWTFGWRVHYIGGASVLGQDHSVTPFASAPPIWYHDLVVSYRMNKLTYTIGADNVTNSRPPTLLDGQSNTDLNTYDIDGPFVYFRITAAL
jgi:iron complex outermembrane receptor protein